MKLRALRWLAMGVVAVTAFAAGGALAWLARRPFTYEARREVEPFVATASALDDAALDAGLTPAADADRDAATGSVPVEPDDSDVPAVPAEIVPVRTEHASSPSFEATSSYALIGIDSRSPGRGAGRADSIVVAIFDRETGHVGLVSIPRDLFVVISGHGPARINAMLRIARRLDRDPIELADEVIEDVLAIPIDHVLVIDLARFEHAIDRLGGIDVEVDCPIVDNFVDARTETGRRLLSLEAGRRHLDGVTAAMYARSRHGRSDWDRARRQQAILLGVRARIGEMSVSEWLPIVIEELEAGITTDMSRLELIQLARLAASVRAERMHGMLIGSRSVETYRTAEGQWVLLPSYDAIDEQLARLFEAPAPGLRPARRECPEADVALTR